MTLQYTFNTEPEKKMHYIAENGEKETTLWDSLGIRLGNGTSPSQVRFALTNRGDGSSSQSLSVYPSGSPFRRSGKLWIPGEEPQSQWSFYQSAPAYPAISWAQVYKAFLGGPDTEPPPQPPVKAERDTPAIGFRAWTVEIRRKKGKEFAFLQGVSHKEPWPGRNTMTFRCDRKHAAPAADCGCGLHAYHEPNGAPEYMGHTWLSDPFQVMGAVIAWGKIIEYENGFRAQFARPIAIGVPPNPNNDTQAFLNEALAEKAATLLELPCVPYKSLVTYAREFGERLTA